MWTVIVGGRQPVSAAASAAPRWRPASAPRSRTGRRRSRNRSDGAVQRLHRRVREVGQREVASSVGVPPSAALTSVVLRRGTAASVAPRVHRRRHRLGDQRRAAVQQRLRLRRNPALSTPVVDAGSVHDTPANSPAASPARCCWRPRRPRSPCPRRRRRGESDAVHGTTAIAPEGLRVARERAADRRAVLDRREHHVLQPDVDAVDRAAVDLGRDVDAREGLADDRKAAGSVRRRSAGTDCVAAAARRAGRSSTTAWTVARSGVGDGRALRG